jgi:purine-binding chemotaxis protein CheW
VTCAVAGEEYGLPVESVREVLRYERPRTVPGASGALLGVLALRGRAIPVADLGRALGLGERPGAFEPAAGAAVVVLEERTRALGLVVDRVADVVTVAGEQLEALPFAPGAHVAAIATLGERLVVLLDAASLVRELAAR